jgi:hypothetical protein
MVCVFSPYRHSLGFLNFRYFGLKFQKHAKDFGITSRLEYARRADALFGLPAVPARLVRPPAGPVEECKRKCDDCTLRYNNATREFGIRDRDNYLRNYYPIPDRQYFIDECKK